MTCSSYQTGACVIYGRNGICRIDDITQHQFASDPIPRLYYVLKPLYTTGATYFIPADNKTLFDKMRPALTRSEIETLLEDIGENTPKWVPDKTARKAGFDEILREGMGCNLFRMIRCIYLKRQELVSSGKKLTTADESALKSAECLVREEFSYSLAIEPEKVGAFIHSRLNGYDQLSPVNA